MPLKSEHGPEQTALTRSKPAASARQLLRESESASGAVIRNNGYIFRNRYLSGVAIQTPAAVGAVGALFHELDRGQQQMKIAF